MRGLKTGAVLLPALYLAGCVSEGTPTPPPWVSFDDDFSLETLGSAIALSGGVTCDTCPSPASGSGVCPSLPAPPPPNVTVSWTNLTTGASGPADVGTGFSCVCPFGMTWCVSSWNAGWSATVPLTFGPNLIEATAMDSSGQTGTARAWVVRVLPSPLGLVAEGLAGGVQLTWPGVPGATSYNLYWSTAPDATVGSANRIEGATSPYVHDPGGDATIHYFVTALEGAHESWSSEKVFATPGWHSELLSSDGGSDVSAAIGPDGTLHVVYGLAKCVVSSGWSCVDVEYANHYLTRGTTITTGPPPDASLHLAPRIALDSGGVPHIVYLDADGARHATLASGGWSAEVVDASATCRAALAMDGTGQPRLAYSAEIPFGYGVLQAVSTAGGWTTEIVQSSTSGGCNLFMAPLSLGVDGAGNAHVLFVVGTELRHATDLSGAWEVTAVPSPPVQDFAALLDGAGNLHAALRDPYGALSYARRASSGDWSFEAIDDRASHPSIALDPGGGVHVAYYREWTSRAGQILHATRSGGVWHRAALHEATATSAATAVAADALGRIHVLGFAPAGLVHTAHE